MKAKSQIARSNVASLPPTSRSRVGNGRDLLPDIDGRSAVARRYKEILGSVIADQGGEANLSEARQQLVRRFAAAAVLAEALESKIIQGESFDIEQHAKLSATLVKLAQRIGLGRHLKTVQSLDDYLRSKQQQRDDAEVIEHDAEPAS